MNRHARTSRGFTIVELLIVVVIIAILAAITLVTYSGIQQRANNAAIIDAASKSLRMIQAYIAANDKYPLINGNACITTTSGCIVNSSVFGVNTTFNTNMSTIGTLPLSIPMSGTNQTGVWYTYSSTRKYNGNAQPVFVVYWLYGTSQQCGLANVASGWDGATTSSSVGYSYADDNGKTLCYISVPGPTA